VAAGRNADEHREASSRNALQGSGLDAVMLYIIAHVRKEGHGDQDDKSLFPRLVNGLFLMGTTEEKTAIFKFASETYNGLLRSDAPNVREWRTSLLDLVFLYLIDDKTLKQRGFPVLFGSMMKSLISAEE
jgi:hypothetical protein